MATGSTCSTIKPEPSNVLKAIDLSEDECFQKIRLGLGRITTEESMKEINHLFSS